MNFINLAHGSLYMMGAFIAATVFRHSGSFLLAAAAVVAGMALLGLVLDRVALWRGSIREHLDQVLATFGFILFFNELTRASSGVRRPSAWGCRSGCPAPSTCSA